MWLRFSSVKLQMTSMLFTVLLLSTVAGQTVENRWKVFTPSCDDFAVSLPQPIKEDTESARLFNQGVTFRAYSAPSPDSYLSVLSFKSQDVPAPHDAAKLDAFAAEFGKEMYSRFSAIISRESNKGSASSTMVDAPIELKFATQIELDGYIGGEYHETWNNIFFVSRIYAADERFYLLMAVSKTPVTQDAERFFASFDLSRQRAAQIARESQSDDDPPVVIGSTSKSVPTASFNPAVLNGKRVCGAQPAYPSTAKAVRAQGEVRVQVTINKAGRVVTAQAVSGHPLLRSAAVDAAREWRFTPTLLSGTPVHVTGTIIFNFTLDPVPKQ